MGIKSIFQEGMKERKRKKSLSKVNNEFKDKERVHAGQLIALGQKAWEAKADISAFSDLQAPLADAQKTLDDLRTQAKQLQKQKLDSEAKKKQENDRFGAGQKETEEKKREVDKRLNEQKSTLLAGQRETQRATSRLAASANERGQLQNKNANPETAETEKLEIAKGLDLLTREEEELKAGISARAEAGKPVATLIAALQEESAQWQKQLEGLRNEQKKMLAEMDKTIATLNMDLTKNSEKTKEAESKQKLEFKRLGEKLATVQNMNPDIAKEMAAVQNARTEMEGVQALIGGLDRQKDESQVSAYKKMKAIIVGGIVLAAAIIVLLVVLLTPKKSDNPFNRLTNPGQASVNDLGEIARQMQKLGSIKAESEKSQGQKIVVASESMLTPTLPAVGGWQMQNPNYKRGAFGELETASLQAGYAAADGRTVQVQITDAGTASALLSPLKMVFAMNVSIDDKDAFQRVSTYNGIPVAERFDKRDREASFGIIYKDRYLIEFKTKADKGLELLKEFAAKMDLSKLQQ